MTVYIPIYGSFKTQTPDRSACNFGRTSSYLWLQLSSQFLLLKSTVVVGESHMCGPKSSTSASLWWNQCFFPSDMSISPLLKVIPLIFVVKIPRSHCATYVASAVPHWGTPGPSPEHLWLSHIFHMGIPIGSMYGIYTNIGGILMVNVTIYSIHGSYGI